MASMQNLSAVNAVLAALGRAAVKGLDVTSLKAAGFDAAAFRAAGCDWSTIKTAGFSAAEIKAAGCDLATARGEGYDALSLVGVFGYDAVAAAGVDVSCILAVLTAGFGVSCILVSVLLCTHACSN